MTNKTKILIGVGVGAGLIGLYLFLKPKNKTGQKGCPDGFMKDAGSDACVPIVIPPPKDDSDDDDSVYDSGYTDPDTPTWSCLSYEVTTNYKNLNVRTQPNINSSIAKDKYGKDIAIPKGEIVKAIPSSVSGWMELCSTATTVYTPPQFVSSAYLKVLESNFADERS